MALSPEEEEILSRYRKMLKLGMPEGAVLQKMAAEGVTKNLQDAIMDESMAAVDDRGADPPETVVDIPSQNRPVQRLDPVKPDSVSSFFEEVIDEDEDGSDTFDEEEIEEEVVFDDDVGGRQGDEIQHQPTVYDSRGRPDSLNSHYTEESYYGSTEGDVYTTVAASRDMENQWQQSQQPQQAPYSTSQQRQQQRNVTFPQPEQAPSSVTPTVEKPLPSPTVLWYWLTCLALLIMMGIAAGMGYFLTLDQDGSAPRVETNVTEAPTLTPVRVSSEFNGVLGSCDFTGISNPNPIDQCDCSGSIRNIPADVRRRYVYNRESFISTLYANYDDDISSCSARNQALVWVSSGDDEEISEALRIERFALATIFASLSGSQWNLRDNWMTYGESSPCNWWGVDCGGFTGAVLGLSIPSNNAEGVLPGEVSLLTSLRSFVAPDNGISGPLPVAMFLIPVLENVDVSINTLTGVIPQTVSQSSLLRTLNVARNSMSGRLTPEIGQAVNLEVLNLNSNGYEGSLPSALFQLPNLKELNIGGNQFSGSISHTISQLSALEGLTLGPNLFSGTIQSTIQDLSNLKLLSIQGIGYTGRLPAAFGQKLTNLETLIITDTQLDGNIDTSFGNLPNLKTFDLNSNRFTSVIPSELGNLQSLVSLRLDNNFMSRQIPETLGNLADLQELWLNNNLLTGGIPRSFGNLSNLQSLRLQANRLQDRVSDEMCALRDGDLVEFIVGCPLEVAGESLGVICPIPDCCTSCENQI
ncbi:RHS repeat-associated core domain containing protein [Nitzschia inconspicua]|uniref:RHS repeat-associated core domain containing protein n=1 Tax=Nitzschia inconspicua TaxID=303405 RepID=A0A9K3KZE2_9STRA|nr:RHS repeat-associated core domain containing protein [Nitzschia inconspicua]